MPIDYSAPERDMRFVMQELVCFEQVAALCGYEEFPRIDHRYSSRGQ